MGQQQNESLGTFFFVLRYCNTRLRAHHFLFYYFSIIDRPDAMLHNNIILLLSEP